MTDTAPLLQIVLEGLWDKIVQVNKKSLTLFQNYIQNAKSIDFRGEESLDQIIKCILNFMSDQRLQKQCNDIYIQLMENPKSDFSFLCHYTFKSSSFF